MELEQFLDSDGTWFWYWYHPDKQWIVVSETSDVVLARVANLKEVREAIAKA